MSRLLKIIFHIFRSETLKKSAFIITGSIVVLFMTCHFFIYNISLFSHRSEFRNYLKQHSEQAQKIEISVDELYKDTKQIKWLDDNAEINYNNELYDVLSLKKENGKIIIYVVNDKVEEIMAEEYAVQTNIIFDKNNNANKGHQLISNFLSLKCIISSPGIIYEQVSDCNYLKEIQFPVCSIYHSVQTPPPNSLV